MNRYIFANPGLIDTSTGYRLCIAPPLRAEPVLVRKFPYERVLLGLYLTVIEEDGKIRLWYGCRSSKESSGKHTAYAESADGTNFEKNGVVIPETMEGALYVDPNETAEKRYGYFGNLHGHGLFRWTSPDGQSFERDPQPLLKFESDTQCSLLWNPQDNQYVAYVRGWNEGGTKNERRRTVMRLSHPRPDLPWPWAPTSRRRSDVARLPHFTNESQIVLRADEDDPAETDIYTMAPHHYNGYWLAFPTFYRHFPEPDCGPYVNGGRTAVQCVGSSDGIAWHRYDRETYASPGIGENMVYMGQGMVHRGEEIWQYGIAYQTHHGEIEKRARDGDGTMYRFVQRKDGFVGATTASRGTLTTRPIPCDGTMLLANIDTDGIGVARFGLLDETGAPIPGFGLSDCAPVTTNSTREQIRWNGSDLNGLPNSHVRVVIESTRTRVYSIWFEQGQ